MLEGDHRTMCRYASTDDPNYKKVAAEICLVYTDLIFKAQGHITESTGLTPAKLNSPNLAGFSITPDSRGKCYSSYLSVYLFLFLPS